MPLYIIRHALKMRDRKAYPDDDSTPLSAEGEAQLPVIGKALRDDINAREIKGKCIVISSDQLRSVQTTERGILPALNGLDVTKFYDPRFKERKRGTAETPEHEEQKRKNTHLLKNHPTPMMVIKNPGGEDGNEVGLRVHDGMRNIHQKYDPQKDTVIIVTHSIPARMIKMLETGEWTDVSRKPIPNSGSILLLTGDNWGHLKDEGYIHAGIEETKTPLEQLSAKPACKHSGKITR